MSGWHINQCVPRTYDPGDEVGLSSGIRTHEENAALKVYIDLPEVPPVLDVKMCEAKRRPGPWPRSHACTVEGISSCVKGRAWPPPHTPRA